MKTSALLFAGLLALQTSGAADILPPKTDEAKSGDEMGAIVLKNKSSFVLDESGRSPFWPIGWKPAPASGGSSVQRVSATISPSSFVVSSITVETGGRYAIINGKVMNEGQIFGLQAGAQVHEITVKAILDGQVILAQQDQEIPVPLRRR
ncbi:MAG: hypothetical protein H0U88_04265 [Chthoniobacterales bacterium]|nr:hypothetical protein [Chthoniobacterales bacterium]